MLFDDVLHLQFVIFSTTSNLSEGETILTRLEKDKTMVIIPADKGKVTVVIEKDEYVKKCEEHLNDENTHNR